MAEKENPTNSPNEHIYIYIYNGFLLQKIMGEKTVGYCSLVLSIDLNIL